MHCALYVFYEANKDDYYESDRHTCHTKISMTQGLTANSS